ncbi:hypothetical protein EV361DRAFT_545304 [Lentinula raphanica]|nr:hypothetical protein EV361DRAFT_545304 [Lentinula raphanica]
MPVIYIYEDQELDFALETFLDSNESWIGSVVLCDSVKPSSTLSHSPLFHPEAATHDILTSYNSTVYPGEFFFDMFGTLKSVYTFNSSNCIQHTAFIGPVTSSSNEDYHYLLFLQQIQALHDFIRQENSNSTCPDHPILVASSFLPNLTVEGFYIEHCVPGYPCSPLIEVEIDKDTMFMSPDFYTNITSGVLDVDRLVALRCCLYREDKLSPSFTSETAIQVKRVSAFNLSSACTSFNVICISVFIVDVHSESTQDRRC